MASTTETFQSFVTIKAVTVYGRTTYRLIGENGKALTERVYGDRRVMVFATAEAATAFAANRCLTVR